MKSKIYLAALKTAFKEILALKAKAAGA